MVHASIDRMPRIESLECGRALESWALPLKTDFLEEFLSYIFNRYWNQIVFGPIIEGAAYELTCPSPPTACSVFDGYLTIAFGGPHFHLCIGENSGPPHAPTPQALKRCRKPSRARIFRRLDAAGAPISWGFEMWNGHGEPMISIFFASPFLESGDRVLDPPQWENLAMWRDISLRYLGRKPDPADETGKGFGGGRA